jgi:esterase/lipase
VCILTKKCNSKLPIRTFACVMKKILTGLVVFIIIVIIAYFAGPKPEQIIIIPEAPALMDPTEFNPEYVQETVDRFNTTSPIRKGNESQIYWADSIGQKTKYVLLYLHGFSASPMEGDPVHMNFAKRYGMNMYAPLLADHGLISDEPMLHFTGDKFVESAKQALRLARLMGDSVIIMSTSTGSTASLFLASGDNDIHSLVCYSPNIKVFDKRASLLTGPWGIDIAKVVKGGDYNVWDAPAGAEAYWHTTYRLEATVQMQLLLESTMIPATFQKVKVPTFVGYYYKNEAEQDDVVSVPAILDMYELLGSANKRLVKFENVGAHALASSYFSSDIEGVSAHTNAFAEEVLGLIPRIN